MTAYNGMLALIWIVCAGLSYLFGKAKGRPVAGAVLGIALGFVGLVITFTLPSRAQLTHDHLMHQYAEITAMRKHLADNGERMTPMDRADYTARITEMTASYERYLNGGAK